MDALVAELATLLSAPAFALGPAIDLEPSTARQQQAGKKGGTRAGIGSEEWNHAHRP